MFYAGTSAPVKKTVWEPERQDNPFLPRLPEPAPVRLPEWLDPNRIPAPVFTPPEREPVPVRVRR